MFEVKRPVRVTTRWVAVVFAVLFASSALTAVGINSASAAGVCTGGGGKYYCDVKLYDVAGRPGAHMIAEPRAGAPVVNVMRTAHSWFKCGVKNDQGGWLYGIGDEGGRWGWVANSHIVQASGPNTPGVPDCNAAPAASRPAPATATAAVSGSGLGAEAARVALAQVGKRYVYGAKGPNSFDCSGLTSFAWKQAGKTIPGSTAGQVGLPVATGGLQPGDLVLYQSGSSPTGRHVGIVVGGGRMVEAASSRTGVINSPIRGGYFKAVRP